MAAITVLLDKSLEAKLAQAAEARHQSPGEFAAEAIANYIVRDDWERTHIRQGLGELEVGDSVSDEAVSVWLDSWGTDDELPVPYK